MPNEHEATVEAGQYESSEELEAKRQLEERVIMIQRNYRRYRLQVCVRRCAAEYRRLMAIKKKQAERDKQDYINSSMNCKDFPKTKRDFDILFSQIADWKEQEVRENVLVVVILQKKASCRTPGGNMSKFYS